jgi:hypothetical protein
MVDLGAKADGACDTAIDTCSLIALVKYLNSAAIAAVPCFPNANWNSNTYGPGVASPTSCDLKGNFWTDLGAINGVALLAGAGVTGTGSPRTTQAQDTTTIAGSAPGTAGSASTNVVTVQGIASGVPQNVTPTPTAGQGCTPYHLSGGTAASTNSTSVKASAVGTVCRWTLVSTSATLAYLKVYDSAGAPTCSSATGLKHVYPIPSGTTGGGLQVIDVMGEAYANGIGFCVTGGGGDTDNTNAPTGVYIEASIK